MRKTLAAGLAALTFGGAIAAAAVPATAEARPYGGYHRGWDRHHNNDAAGAAIVAGIAGLAIGAALADNGHRNAYRGYSYDYGYAPGYYDYDYGYRYRPQVCETRRWVWDPYIGRRVLVRSHYAC
jgi:opacity protein-like surface antigen